MKRTQEQKRAELLAAAAQAIDELLAWDEETARPNLTQIEDEVLAVRHRLGEQMAMILIEGQELRSPVEAPRCAGCGEVMQAKGSKGKTLTSRVGTLPVVREYCYCPHCASGIFPPG